MADTKIKDLTEKATGAASDEFVINDVAGGNADKKLGMDGIRITESQVTDLGSYITPSSTDTLTNKTIDVEDATNVLKQTTPAGGDYLRDNGTKFVSSVILAGDLPTGIDAAKLSGGSVSNTEFDFLDGVTSAIQTQIDTKISDITGSPLDELSDVTAHTPTKGHLLVADGDSWEVLAVGTNDQVLTADSAQTLGVKWAAGGGGGSGQTFARVVKKADETVNNSNTLQDDDELTVSLSANKTYGLYLVVFKNSGSTPDFKMALSVPTDATSRRLDIFRADTDTGISDFTSPTTYTGFGDKAIAVSARVIMAGTAGSITLQWAQDTADASDTKVLEGSHLIVWEETA